MQNEKESESLVPLSGSGGISEKVGSTQLPNLILRAGDDAARRFAGFFAAANPLCSGRRLTNAALNLEPMPAVWVFFASACQRTPHTSSGTATGSCSG